jgi:hypothetical protein
MATPDDTWRVLRRRIQQMAAVHLEILRRNIADHETRIANLSPELRDPNTAVDCAELKRIAPRFARRRAIADERRRREAKLSGRERKPLPTASELNEGNRYVWGQMTAYADAQVKDVVAVHHQGHAKRRVKGGKNSGKVRASKNVERDRRIHDAHADGKGLPPKLIAGNRKILGEKELSASQIRRILKDPRP